jgi:TolB-like protein
MDTELTKLTEQLASQIKDHDRKKVTVLDFTDLDGNTSEIGKYAAEQLTVDFVMKKRDFAVLDRANLKKIMDEHKLTASGLVDPENAKKLGMFAGVDAMVFGKIISGVGKVNVTTKVVTTDTAEIIGGGKASFLDDSTTQQLKTAPVTVTKPATDTATAPDLSDDKPIVVKIFGNLLVELQSLKIINGGQYFLTMTLTNRSAKDSLWVALSPGNNGNTKASLLDKNGSQFDGQNTTGISYARLYPFARPVTGPNGSLASGGFQSSIEIKPGDTTTATITFVSLRGGPRASPGICNLQIEFVVGNDLIYGMAENSASPNLISKMEAK